MKPKLSWVALGAGAYLAFLVATFPAATAVGWFGPDNVSTIAPTGTLWSGRAAAIAMPGVTVTDVRWRISPWPLMLGRLAGDLELRLADGFAATSFSASGGGRIELSGARVSASIEALASLVPVYDTRGQISADLATLTIEDGWPTEASGELRVGALEVAPLIADGSGSRMLLGDFRARLAGAGDGVLVAQLEDLSGPLELDGEVALNPDRSYLFSGRLRARPDASQPLRDGIELMAGEPDANGMREMTLSGSL